MDEIDLADFEAQMGDRLEAYDFDGTYRDAQRILADDKAYTDEMFALYKAGRLDPGPGERGRKEFLQKKFDEMEASGDKRLMTRDEIEELSDMEIDIRSQFPKASDDEIKALVNKVQAEVPKRPANFDELSLDDRRLVDLEAENIYQGILKESDLAALNRPESPTVRGAAREFLVEMLNIDDPVMRTSLADVVDPTDLKYITEGGGGLAGDPIILIEKYFGSRIANQLPKTGNPEDIKIFAQRVTNNVVDEAGRRPTDPRFDKETAMFTDITDIPFAKGGLAKILEV
jgi:hypothetical protein